MKKATALILMAISAQLMAEDCPYKHGSYGVGLPYQTISCRFMVSEQRVDEKINRSLTFTDEGLIQVFSNFPGTTNSNSTGARVYYLFPLRNQKNLEANENGQIQVMHSSGVRFNFDRSGKVSSPDLNMSVAKEINSQNKSGIEIESYPNGLVFDLGYRMGNTPALNKNAMVTVTDKSKKKCSFPNSEFNSIQKDNAELIYKTNEAMHKFLSKKCPGLDLSDLLSPFTGALKDIKKATRPQSDLVKDDNLKMDDNKRGSKPQFDSLDSLIDSLDKKNGVSR